MPTTNFVNQIFQAAKFGWQSLLLAFKFYRVENVLSLRLVCLLFLWCMFCGIYSGGDLDHPLTPWGSHVGIWLDFSWTMIFVPGGASGTLLKLKITFSCYSTDFWLLGLEFSKRFRVRVAWGRSIHQMCTGNYVWAEQSTDTKWFLNVLIALSAAFCLFICGVTSWKSQCLVQISLWNDWYASLSNILNLVHIHL